MTPASARQRERTARQALTDQIWKSLTVARDTGLLTTLQCVEDMHAINDLLKRYARAIRASASGRRGQ